MLSVPGRLCRRIHHGLEGFLVDGQGSYVATFRGLQSDFKSLESDLAGGGVLAFAIGDLPLEATIARVHAEGACSGVPVSAGGEVDLIDAGSDVLLDKILAGLHVEAADGPHEVRVDEIHERVVAGPVLDVQFAVTVDEEATLDFSAVGEADGGQGVHRARVRSLERGERMEREAGCVHVRAASGVAK